MELLAPAGDIERLHFALRYGADAVYLAGKQFGMRASANNFDEDGLKHAVNLVHTNGKRVYLTCNIIPRNADIAAMSDFLAFAQEIGVDALIIGDIGVFKLAERFAPRIARHISTQAGVLNAESARTWYNMGAKRVILAREMSLDEIAELRNLVPKELEIEVFVHGAMCVSFSGRCLLSQYMTGRDANQGNCTQPCRWKYHLVEETRPGQYMEISEDGGTHILNTRDLCMIEHIPALQAAGVDSVKIEGRAKSFYYTAVATNAYRKAIDAALSEQRVSPIWINEVEKVSHRAYSTGFFHNADGGGQYTADALYSRGWAVVGIVDDCGEDGLAHVTQRNRFFVGDCLDLLTPEGEPISFILSALWDASGEPVDVAPNPMATVTLRLPIAAPQYSILRKACGEVS